MGHVCPKLAISSHIFLFLPLRDDLNIPVMKKMVNSPVCAAAPLSVHCDEQMFCPQGLHVSHVTESCELKLSPHEKEISKRKNTLNANLEL